MTHKTTQVVTAECCWCMKRASCPAAPAGRLNPPSTSIFTFTPGLCYVWNWDVLIVSKTILRCFHFNIRLQSTLSTSFRIINTCDDVILLTAIETALIDWRYIFLDGWITSIGVRRFGLGQNRMAKLKKDNPTQYVRFVLLIRSYPDSITEMQALTNNCQDRKHIA